MRCASIIKLRGFTILFNILRSSVVSDEQLAVINLLQLLAYCDDAKPHFLRPEALQVLMSQLNNPELVRTGLLGIAARFLFLEPRFFPSLLSLADLRLRSSVPFCRTCLVARGCHGAAQSGSNEPTDSGDEREGCLCPS